MEEQLGQIETLIISDIHIGSPVCRAKDALSLLKEVFVRMRKVPRTLRFLRIVIGGDLWDHPDLGRLREIEWKLLRYLAWLAKKSWIEVVLVQGNHDGSLAWQLGPLLGMKVCKEYVWVRGGKVYLVIHGDAFDYFLMHNRLVSDVASWIYGRLQALDSKKHRLSHWVKRTSKKWLRVSREVAEGAVKYSARHGAHEVFCGHTHKAVQWVIDSVGYTNTGCWTEGSHSGYATVGTDGTVRLHEYVANE